MAASARIQPGPSNSHHEATYEGTQLPGNDQAYGEWPNALPDRALDHPWARKVILSLDGGGMRGYFSLLIVQQIMDKVKELETRASLLVGSAAYPWCNEPDGRLGNTIGSQSGFRPHHYIDYFVGTSTGGLSAIMLGRLQRTVRATRDKYKIVGNEVFGNPRLGTMFGLLRPRYSDKAMEKILQEATLPDIPHQFSSPSSRVRTGGESRQVVKHVATQAILRAENHDAARTAVVSQGNAISGVRQTYIFRSYDHPAPNRVQSNDSGEEGPWNRGAACDLPIWTVGRATSAAPTYFRPMKVGKEEFRDGGLERQNNPVKLAWTEVLQMHPPHKPLLVISIGTGKKPNAAQKNKWYRGFNKHFHDTLELRKRFQANVLDSHRQLKEFLHDCINNVNDNIAIEGDRVKYCRFDVPDITIHKLDHWKGMNGDDTKNALKSAAKKYCKEPEVKKSIEECARMLVDLRRRRAQTEHWERFAMHLMYSCPLSHPNPGVTGHTHCRSNLFETRDALRQHAIKEHGFARQVTCANATGTIIGQWICDRDDCETQIIVFEQRLQFDQHLLVRHNVQVEVPWVQSNAQFERWLDGGRQPKYGVNPIPRSTTLASTQGTDRSL